ncbi:MAG: mechanosensitive ion channel protein MscS [Phycisphaeraceae bacterium]|nr:MAG: mechanosensitive ion channel protein MscS [Phycisphaeraceae bacterium]
MQDTPAAPTATDAAEVVTNNETLQKAQDVLSRVIEGDFSQQTWIDLWGAVGWPVAKAILLILAVLMVSGWVRRFTTSALRKTKLDETLARFFGNMARWCVMLLGVLTILSTFGVETTSFAAVIAALGFAVGMAMSGMLSNFAAGIMLLIFRPFKIGDYVKAAGIAGTIDEIGIFTTTFDTLQKARIIIPNAKIFGDTIENVSHHPVRRMDVNLGTSYEEDVDETRAVLTRVVNNVEGHVSDPEPKVYLDSLGDNSVNWQLRVWAKADDLWPMRERLIRDAKKALDEANIAIPYPQQDVHVNAPITVRMAKD